MSTEHNDRWDASRQTFHTGCMSTFFESATAVAPTGVLRKTYFVRTIIRNHECNMEGSSTQDHLMSSASRLVGNFSTFLPHLGHTNREVKPEVKTVENLAKV